MKFILLIGLSLYFTRVFSQQSTALDSFYQTDPKSQLLRTKLDSLSRGVSTPKSDSLERAWRSQLDKWDKLSQGSDGPDSLQGHYQSQVDSLKTLDLPPEKHLSKLDSITNLPNEKISEKMTALRDQGNEKLQSWKRDINEKTDVGIPDVNGEKHLDESGLAGVEASTITEKVTIEELDVELELPGKIVDTGEFREELDMDNVQRKVDQIQDVPTQKIERGKEAIHMDNISGELDKVSELSREGEYYAKEARAMKEGDFTSIEEKAGQEMNNNFGEIAGLERQKDILEQAKQEHEEYLELQREYLAEARKYSDPEFIKQRIMEKSKYVANQKLAEYKIQVEKAQRDLLELNIDSAESIVDVTGTSAWPFRERAILGINLEPMHNETTLLDLAPYLGFMLNDKWHVYGSYIYRVPLASRSWFESDDLVYGPRIATSYRFFKGFYARFSGEQIRTNVLVAHKGDEITRKWVYGIYAGVGNRYNIARHVKGTIQLMYNFLHDEKSPYTRTFNIRMGFEIDLRKRTTRKDIIEEMERKGKIKRTLNFLRK